MFHCAIFGESINNETCRNCLRRYLRKHVNRKFDKQNFIFIIHLQISVIDVIRLIFLFLLIMKRKQCDTRFNSNYFCTFLQIFIYIWFWNVSMMACRFWLSSWVTPDIIIWYHNLYTLAGKMNYNNSRAIPETFFHAIIWKISSPFYALNFVWTIFKLFQ